MSRAKAKLSYDCVVTKFGTSAKINCNKEFIGRIARVKILKEDKKDGLYNKK